MIVAGRIVAEGAPDVLTDPGRTATTIRFLLPADVGIDDLPQLPGARAAVAVGQVEISTVEPTAVLHALTSWALRRGQELEGLTATRPNLEDVYLALTARPESAGG